MSATLDANILIIAANVESPYNSIARQVMEEVLNADEPLYLFWPVFVAYLRVTTHPRLFRSPFAMSVSLENVRNIIEHQNVRIGVEGPDLLERLTRECEASGIRGQVVHDAHLVALMRQHNVDTIYTQDSDFLKFKDITVINPFA